MFEILENLPYFLNMHVQLSSRSLARLYNCIDSPELSLLSYVMSTTSLNRSPEFCLTLTYRYLLKAVPGDTWGRADFGPRGII